MTLEPTAESGRARLDFSIDDVVQALRPVAIDPLSDETLAMDKLILVDRKSNTIVGGSQLMATGAPLAIDGRFDTWKASDNSEKWGARPGNVKLEEVTVDGHSFTALRSQWHQLDGQRVNQRVQLTPGQLYLLEYWINSENTDGAITIMLYDPSKRIFSSVDHSYFNKMPPFGKWVQQRVLYRPESDAIDIGIVVGVAGTGAIGDIRLTPVEWQFVADVTPEMQAVDLYAVLTGGHRLTQPWSAAGEPANNVVQTTGVTADLADLNPDGLLLELGDGFSAWTIPSYLPMRAETLNLTRPRKANADSAVQVSLLRGAATTVLVAVETGTPLARVLDARCNLPVHNEFARLAAIPVLDSFFPEGKQFETRLDAMVPIDFALMPPSVDGVHVVALTLRAPSDAKDGTHTGTIRLTVESQEPAVKDIQIPITLNIVPAHVKPMHHFGTMSGTAQFSAVYNSEPAGFTKDSVTVGEFHGIRGENMGDDFISRLSLPDRDEPHKAPLRDLGRKYAHRSLDFDIVPAHLTYLARYSYDIVYEGNDPRPRFANWDFTEYDKAIDQLVIERDAPWVVVWHTGGDLMRFFELWDGTTFSVDPPTDKHPVRQLPREEYLEMLGDYFDAIATHLHGKGVLDRAVVVIDESTPDTFDMIRDVVRELRSRSMASKFIIAHTTQTISTYTQRLPDGTLLMDALLDMPMPQQDEHFNYFEPEWAARFKRPGMQSWVYYVQTDRLNIHNAGLSTVLTPLQLREQGAKGWYLWATTIWSMPYKNFNLKGAEYWHGPTINPWVNPFYHHGFGMLCFFYPPDPRGPAAEPTDLIIPSYRLALIRDGINDHALLDVAERGQDDDGNAIAIDRQKLDEAQVSLRQLWPGNPVQWYLSYGSYRDAHRALEQAFTN